MAPLNFRSWYDNFALQALHISLPSEASRIDHINQTANMSPPLNIGYKKGSDVVFDNSLYLPLEAVLPSPFPACCTQEAQDIATYFTNPTAIDCVPKIPHIPIKCAPIIRRSDTWYCHLCGNSYSFNTSRCVQCDHDRCAYCTVE